MNIENAFLKNNEKNLLRITIICSDVKKYIQRAQQIMQDRAASDSRFQSFIKKQASEMDELETRYRNFIEECSFDKVIVKEETVHLFKEHAKKIKDRIQDVLFPEQAASNGGFIFSDAYPFIQKEGNDL